jgi:hypothetical protein
MQGLLTNWMTTVPGVVSLLLALWNMWQTKTIDVEVLRQLLVGVGLIAAKDFNVVGAPGK